MSIPPGSRATKRVDTFRLAHGISAQIRAPAERIWSLLTNAAEFPRWNSTVTSIEGEIALGKKITLRVPSSPRAFTLTITELEPNKRMVWKSGAAPMFKGERTFLLVPLSDGSTEFCMDEVITGLMLPLIKGSLPDFQPIFERYAADLQREAEKAGR
jgi:hypothetical protein